MLRRCILDVQQMRLNRGNALAEVCKTQGCMHTWNRDGLFSIRDFPAFSYEVNPKDFSGLRLIAHRRCSARIGSCMLPFSLARKNSGYLFSSLVRVSGVRTGTSLIISGSLYNCKVASTL